MRILRSHENPPKNLPKKTASGHVPPAVPRPRGLTELGRRGRGLLAPRQAQLRRGVAGVQLGEAQATGVLRRGGDAGAREDLSW
jgi:hypothetical protein